MNRNGLRNNKAEDELREALYALNRSLNALVENDHDESFRDQHRDIEWARNKVWEIGVTRFGWVD